MMDIEVPEFDHKSTVKNFPHLFDNFLFFGHEKRVENYLPVGI